MTDRGNPNDSSELSTTPWEVQSFSESGVIERPISITQPHVLG